MVLGSLYVVATYLQPSTSSYEDIQDMKRLYPIVWGQAIAKSRGNDRSLVVDTERVGNMP